MSPRSSDDPVAPLHRSVQDLVARRRLRNVDLTLGDITATALEVVPRAAGAGITCCRDDRVEAGHATDEHVGRLDGYQAELEEGPGVTALRGDPADGPVVAVDLGGVDSYRWPRFAPLAAHLGYRSILSIHLAAANGRPRRALNLYATEPQAFDDDHRLVATAFAAQAAALLHGAEEAQHLIRALESRDVIAQAKGILMERFGITDEAAFAMLRTSSQETNMKLLSVASWLVGEALRRNEETTADGQQSSPGIAT
ncbi:ANTAR domain-containing protein [Actinomycetospora succinea]|uniref:ANTAR domain-containing protein n=1 Tax=Actinomycetospora succinea TaxID=663603 RepID=UPI001FB7D95C|nr:ANTAR domain-containing protein [Actinomycetospora succinea]